MKILCVHQGHEMYGSDRSFISSLEALVNKYPNSEFTVVIPRTGQLYNALKIIVSDVRVIEIGTIQKKDLKRPISTLIRIFKSSICARKLIKEYDFIYINTIVILAFNFALLFSKSNAVIHVREIPSTIISLIFSSLLYINRAFLIFNSKSTRNSFFFVDNNRSAVILNGVEAKKVSIEKKQSDFFIILIVGRLIPWKGQELLIKAFQKLKLSHENIKLCIAGGPPQGRDEYAQHLKNLVSELNIENDVKMLGFTNNTSELYINSDLVVVPSLKPEPFGRVAIEAMSYGRPVVAARHGGLVEIIKDNEGGLLFEPNSTDDLVKKISLFVENKEFLSAQSIKAEECYKDRFTVAIYQSKFLNVLSELIK